jgi:DNA polymerase-3 subunit alpha
LIRGRLSIREDEEPKLLAEEIKPLKKFEDSDSRELGKKLYLKIPMDRSGEMINAIKPILASKKGTTPVYLCIQDDKSSKRDIRIAGKELWVEVNQELLSRLCDILGEESVKVC